MPGEIQQAQADPIGLLLMVFSMQLDLHPLQNIIPDILGPVHDPAGRPLMMLLMVRGHMFRVSGGAGDITSGMTGYPLMIEVALQEIGFGMQLKLFSDQVMGYRIQMILILDVVSDIAPHCFDIGLFIGEPG